VTEANSNRIADLDGVVARSTIEDSSSADFQLEPISNGNANKLDSRDRAAHDWYRFVLSFPPHLVRHYLARFQIGPVHRVLDPFCGTGTTIVECKKLGIEGTGIESNPMARFACETKTSWEIDSAEFCSNAQEVGQAALAKLRSRNLHDDPRPANLLVPLVQLSSLPSEAEQILLRDSISPLPLHKSLVLLDAISAVGDVRFSNHFRLALAREAAYSSSNLRFGPEIGLGNRKKDAPVISGWLQAIRQMAVDLEQLRQRTQVPSFVFQADSRSIPAEIPPSSIDAVITSPPYPNEKDYTRTTRLESVLLGFLKNKADLRQLKQSLIRSNTRNVYRGDTDERWVEQFPVIQDLAERIEKKRVELGKTSGFERLYARVTKLYFGGMARHLSDLPRILRPGAKLAYVVGDQASYLRVMIRTGAILAEIATSLGYEVVGTDLFRTRLATATREQLREEVVCLRWP
jgi:SAM-dependent methyltransferase